MSEKAQKEADFCYFLHQRMRWRALPEDTYIVQLLYLFVNQLYTSRFNINL